MKKKFCKNKVLALALAAAMILSLSPINALATEGTEAGAGAESVSGNDPFELPSASSDAVGKSSTDGIMTADSDADSMEGPVSGNTIEVGNATDLQNALDAAVSTNAIVLTADIDGNFKITKDTVLDLAGYTLTGTETTAAVIEIKGATAYIVDSTASLSLTGNGTITGGTKSGIYIYNGNAYIEGINIKANTNSEQITRMTIGGVTRTCSAGGGAGIFAINSTDVTVINVCLENNTATDFYGGAIGFYAFTTTVSGKSDVWGADGTIGSVDKGPDNDSVTLDYILNVEDCTIKNNSAIGGGGIYLGGEGADKIAKTLHLSDSVISNNIAKSFSGGGVMISSNNSVGIITDTAFSNNQAYYYGGALYTGVSSATVTKTTMENNTAGYYGGAVGAENGTIELNSTTVSGNSASYGGGVYLSACTLTTADETKLLNNKAKYGGAVYTYKADSTDIIDTTVSGNSATERAGGVYVTNSNVNISGNSIIADNHAPYGGAIFNFGTLVINDSCKITTNTASQRGGGIYSTAGKNTISGSSAIYNNTAVTAGDDIYLYKKSTLVLPSVGSDWTLASDNKAIDNWYYDAADARWNEASAKAVQASDDSASDTGSITLQCDDTTASYAIKAAHGITKKDPSPATPDRPSPSPAPSPSPDPDQGTDPTPSTDPDKPTSPDETTDPDKTPDSGDKDNGTDGDDNPTTPVTPDNGGNNGGNNNGGNNTNNNAGNNNGGNAVVITPAVPAAANNAVVPVPATADNDITDITDDETPLADGDDVVTNDAADDTTQIDDEATPAAAGDGAWALINLILAIVTVLLSLILLITYFGKRKEEREDEDGNIVYDEDGNAEIEAEYKKRGGWRLASLIPAIVSVVAFILTEDMSLPMHMIDRWTLLMLIITIIQIIIAVLSKKKKNDGDDEDEEKVTA